MSLCKYKPRDVHSSRPWFGPPSLAVCVPDRHVSSPTGYMQGIPIHAPQVFQAFTYRV